MTPSTVNALQEIIGHLFLVVIFVAVCLFVVWLNLPEEYTPEPTPLTQEEYVEQLIELQDNVLRLRKELYEIQELKLLELEGKAFIL